MIVHFPDSNCGSRKIKSHSVHKKLLTYYLVVEFFEDVELYNHKFKKYETKSKVIIKSRGLKRFTKFFKNPFTEIFIISIEDNIILDVGELVQD